MAETWADVFQTKTWIPPEILTSFLAVLAAAKAILAVVKSGERTASSVVKCNEAFKELETEMRFIKKHFLLIPPLVLADLPTLLLPLPDDTHTPISPPTGQPAITITYPGGPHVVQIHLASLSGTEPLNSRGDYGYAVYRGVMPPGGATLEQAASVKHYLMTAPLSGDELLHYRFTRRKKELVDFSAEESGMTVYFCARYENQKGQFGVWGPVVSAVIP
ncbi:hypothetical protein PilKf_01861 [Pillotina sp. SPG140]|jgi:hypothetical protein